MSQVLLRVYLEYQLHSEFMWSGGARGREIEDNEHKSITDFSINQTPNMTGKTNSEHPEVLGSV